MSDQTEEQTNVPVLTETEAIEVYLLSRFEKTVAEVIKVRKDNLKAKLGAEKEFEVGGLKFKTQKPQARKSFDAPKALEKLKGTKYADVDLVIKPIGPVKDIPQEAYDYLSKYFTLEKRISVSEGNAELAIKNGDAEEADCYTFGKEFFNLMLPTKVSDKELADRYKQLNGDLAAAMLLKAPDGAA